MGVGNTGEFLDQAADTLCTWLSRDGGLTWEDVASSSGIYECAPCLPSLTYLLSWGSVQVLYTHALALCTPHYGYQPQLLLGAEAHAIARYGDHGGLIVMATHETMGPAEEVRFSTDLGSCWHTVRLSEAINIQNIRCVWSFGSCGLNYVFGVAWWSAHYTIETPSRH